MSNLSLIQRCQRDPAFFVNYVVGDQLWAKQVEILNSVRDHKRTAVRSCHGAGKSFTAARAALWFLFCNPGSIVATTAPTFRQVRAVLWQEIRKAYSKAKLPLGGKLLQTELPVADGWFAFGFSTDDPDAFQGLHSSSGKVLVILDEASGVPRPIWEAVEGVLTSDDCRLLAIGNPTDPSSAFADEFRVPGTNRITISAFDTPNLRLGRTVVPGLVSAEWVEDKKRRWGETSPMYVARVLGMFPDISTDTLFPLSWLEKARDLAAKVTPQGFPELGQDVARFGDDASVTFAKFRTREGGRLLKFLQEWNKEGTDQTTGRVINLIREHNATAVRVDDSGVGGGVTDQLKAAQVFVNGQLPALNPAVSVIPVNVGEAATDTDHFANLKAELYWGMREDVYSGQLALDIDDETLAQLSSLKYKFTPKGQIIIESKQDMKKRGLPSPDKAEAAMLAHAKLTSVPLAGPGGSTAMSGWAV